MLSADAFAAFEDAGLEDEAAVSETGRRFRDTVLALGGGREPGAVFKVGILPAFLATVVPASAVHCMVSRWSVSTFTVPVHNTAEIFRPSRVRTLPCFSSSAAASATAGLPRPRPNPRGATAPQWPAPGCGVIAGADFKVVWGLWTAASLCIIPGIAHDQIYLKRELTGM